MLLLGIAGIAVMAILALGAWLYFASNVEEPKYRVVVADGAIEVREYPPLVVAEVTRSGDRWAAVNAGFGPLARYIFAEDRAGDSIAMTAPVTQQQTRIAMTAPVTQSKVEDAQSDTWVVRFVMPSAYTLESLPKPASADVTLRQLPETQRAVIRFSGVATDRLVAEQEATLRAWLAARQLEVSGPPTIAYYNPPLTPGPLRRNEVMLQLLEEPPSP
jgi:hypothetical protein